MREGKRCGTQGEDLDAQNPYGQHGFVSCNTDSEPTGPSVWLTCRSHLHPYHRQTLELLLFEDSSTMQIDVRKDEAKGMYSYLPPQQVLNKRINHSKITVDGDCSHEIKRCLFLGRKVMTNLDSRDIKKQIIKKQRHYFANKVWFFTSLPWM